MFDPSGRHLRTVDALTGARRHSFAYDGQGRLIAVTAGADSEGNTTTIERIGDGRPVALVAPDGQRTELELDAQGLLSRITNAAHESVHAEYTDGGLLARYTGPGGETSSYAYDESGRLVRYAHAGGKATTLTRRGSAKGFTVTRLSPLLSESRYEVDSLSAGRESRTSRCCGSPGTVTDTRPDASQRIAFADGSAIDEDLARTRVRFARALQARAHDDDRRWARLPDGGDPHGRASRGLDPLEARK